MEGFKTLERIKASLGCHTCVHVRCVRGREDACVPWHGPRTYGTGRFGVGSSQHRVVPASRFSLALTP